MRFLLNIFFLLTLASALSGQRLQLQSCPAGQIKSSDDVAKPPSVSNDTVYYNLRICTRLWCTDAVVSDVDDYFNQIPFQLQPDGCYTIDTTLVLTNLSFTPSKDDGPLNGVDILDLVLISQHILGITPLPGPYAIIAADFNNSRSITTFDIVESRKMLTGIYDSIPSNTSWRFIDANYLFPNPNNPFSTIFPEIISYNPVNDTLIADIKFVAVKTGDVNCSANPGLTAAPEERSLAYLNIPDQLLQPGQTVELPIRFSEPETWLGFQLGLQFDPEKLILEAVLPGDLPAWDAYTAAAPRPGLLNVLWFDTAPFMISPEKPLFRLRLRALEPLQLSETLQLAKGALRAEAFTGASEGRNLHLQFSPVTSGSIQIGWPSPNPTGSSAWLPLNLPAPTQVQLDVWDVQGRRIWSRNWTGNSGQQGVELPETAFPGSGIYLWRLAAGAAVQSGRLLVKSW